MVQNFDNGSRYEGCMLYDKRNGKGSFYFADGGVYTGNWINNKMEGYGILYLKSGKPAYKGNWYRNIMYIFKEK